MTVYEIPNIEHCDIEIVASGRIYKINSHEGWYIHINSEATENIYKRAVGLLTTFDFSLVVIIPESELPEGAEVMGGGNDPEIM